MFHNFRLDQKAVPSVQIRNILQWYESLGRNTDDLLRDTAIATELLADDDQRFSYRQKIKLIENLQNCELPAGYWLNRNHEILFSDFGLLGYAMMSCETLEQAIHIAVKYHRTAGAMFDLQFVTEDDSAILRIDHVMAGGAVGCYLVEELFIGIPVLVSMLIGRSHQLTEIHFNYQKPVYAQRYDELFNCPIHFEMPFCEYRFPAAHLSQKLAKADPNIAKMCEASCLNLLNQMNLEQGLVSQISHSLLSQPGYFPSLEVIADRLHIGARTLRRRLSALGTNYQHILDDVRYELATEYLTTTDLSVSEISDLLGFSESTNFRRAYLKWSGESPYQYRKRYSTG